MLIFCGNAELVFGDGVGDENEFGELYGAPVKLEPKVVCDGISVNAGTSLDGETGNGDFIACRCVLISSKISASWMGKRETVTGSVMLVL